MIGLRRCLWACCAATMLALPAGWLLAEGSATSPASQTAPAAFAWRAQAHAQEPSTQPAGPICVAVLEPEVLADLPTEERKALADPAAQMAVANRLKSLGLEVVVPKDPVSGWKQSLLETGKYGQQKVDFLLEGEGISAHAAEIQGIVSCRARVELRLIAVPGRAVTVSDKGVAARVDLVEALAAKSALEDAAANALDAVILRQVKDADRP